MCSYELRYAQKYGYDYLKTYRQVRLDELRAMGMDFGIGIANDRNF